MPSARKRRLRSLIKGYINRTDSEGSVINDTPSKQLVASSVINAMDEATLKTTLSISVDGKTSDVDADGVTQANDYAPFDATEQVGSGATGDNQRIVDFYQEMVSLTAELTGLTGATTTSRDDADTALTAAQTNKKTGTNDAAAWCNAISSLQSAEAIGSANEESAVAKLSTVTSLETRILAFEQPLTTNVSLEGLNPRTIYDTDAALKQNEAVFEEGQISTLNAEISTSVSTVAALEGATPSEIPDGADCPI